MRITTLLTRLSWVLVDQGLVSLGTFTVSITLARSLPPADYGSFATIFAFLLLLQVFNTSLIFYPLTLRIQPRPTRDEVVAASLRLMAATTLVLMLVAGAALVVFGHQELIPVTFLWFLAWQCQETLRRVLFAEFRYRAAVVGDAVSYIGAASLIGMLAHLGELSLSRAILVLAGAAAAAGVIQYAQVGANWARPRNLKVYALDYWTIGRWSLASSFATALRLNGILWIIIIMLDRSDVALFQAADNVARIANPILFGICNIIPQTAAAREVGEERDSAWRATVHYASLGLVPLLAYSWLAVSYPQLILRIFYGPDSIYVGSALAVQVLVVSFLVSYVVEAICSHMNGVAAPRPALIVNIYGNIALFGSAPLFIVEFGWLGACYGVALANGVRLVVIALLLAQISMRGRRYSFGNVSRR